MNYVDRNSPIIGASVSRIDGPLKVSGRATYTSDHHFPGMLYAVPVESTIASGAITRLDVSAAEALPGVHAILHHDNIGKLSQVNDPKAAKVDEQRPPFADSEVRYYGQYVAAVIADTFEHAAAAAAAVKVDYAEKAFDVSEQLSADKLETESERGDADKAFGDAPVTIDETYVTPAETHNAIELHATVAVYDNGAFTLYETTQGIVNHQAVAAQMLDTSKDSVRIVSRFLGSGFGSKLWPWPHCFIAAAAAKQFGRPVKLVLSRKMNFESAGHRPLTQQRIRLGADKDGKLRALGHDYLNHTSILDSYKENCGEATPFMYSTPNLRVRSALAHRNVGTPTSMRGPGAVPGLFALESGMDELAVQLGIDPVQLRLVNEPSVDESTGLPFSSRHYSECLTTGAKRFGWERRDPKIGAMKSDGLTLGWGVAGCSWVALRWPTEITVELKADGSARVACATQDIGTGTYTVVAQLVSDGTGLPLDRIEVVLGDSDLPPGPISGGSGATASVIGPLRQAMAHAIDQVLTLATKTPNSPLLNRAPESLMFAGGAVRAKDGSASLPFGRIIEMAGVPAVSGKGKGPGGSDEPLKKKYSLHSFGAQFAEVTWQPEIARLRVSRIVTVIDGGRVVNLKTARNQIEGALVMGVGMAMFEETHYDPRNGAPVNSNLADYIVASHADTPDLDVTFLDHPDLVFNEVGARGLGEIGLAGIAAAITNAVYHATGMRVRRLPVKIEDLLAA